MSSRISDRMFLEAMLAVSGALQRLLQTVKRVESIRVGLMPYSGGSHCGSCGCCDCGLGMAP